MWERKKVSPAEGLAKVDTKPLTHGKVREKRADSCDLERKK